MMIVKEQTIKQETKMSREYIAKLEAYLRGAANSREDFIDLYDMFIKPLK